MSIFYGIRGNLYFASDAEARVHYERLTTDDESLFSLEPDPSRPTVVLAGKKIAFWEYGSFISAGLFLTTQDMIVEIVGKAVRGKITFKEGESSQRYTESYVSPGLLREWERKRRKTMEKEGFFRYSFDGELTFADEETARSLFVRLTDHAEPTVFSFAALRSNRAVVVLAGVTISVDDDNAIVRSETYTRTLDLLREAAARAESGTILVEEVDLDGAPLARFEIAAP